MENTDAPSVMAAMSGGVDSSVCAFLLCEAGYEVTGATMVLHGEGAAGGVAGMGSAEIGELGEDEPALDARRAGSSPPLRRASRIEMSRPEGSRTDEVSQTEGFRAAGAACGSSGDVEDAREVCRRLGVPHLTFDFSDRFSEAVIDRFCAAYLGGVTPNPCIECNRHLKFAALQERRRALGFDYVATGHYARRAFDEATGRWQLLRGRDGAKDQSYVLYHLTQDTLAHMLFPLGDLTKAEVRELARARGFATAEKAESQDICFIPDGDYAGYIERRCGGDGEGLPGAFQPGEIVDRAGRVLGEHRGLVYYTIGQRKGIGVAAPEPLYVCAKDATAGRLVVGYRDELMSRGVVARDVNLIAGKPLATPRAVQVKTHYRQRPVGARVEQTGEDELTIIFDEPQRSSAPGQAAVIYEGDVVLGGGTIVGAL